MKKHLLSFLILITVVQLNAQVIFNKAYHDTNEKPNPFLVSIYGDLYFTTQDYDAFYPSVCHLYKHNHLGQLKFRSSLLGNNTADLAFESYDHKLIVVGHESACDVHGPTQKNFITKLDTSASTVFSSTFNVNFWDDPKAALQQTDSSYWVFTDSLLFMFNKTGQFATMQYPGFKSISAALLLQNGTVLVSAKLSGVNSLVLLSQAGATLSVLPFTSQKKMLHYGAQGIMALGQDGKFYKFTAGLAPMGQSTFTGSANILDFICGADTVYAILNSATALSNYLVCDSSFNVISLTSTTTHSISQIAINLSGRSTAILANGISKSSYGVPEHTYSSLSLLNTLASNNFPEDIALVSISADSSYMNCNPMNIPPGSYYCTPYLRARAKVKNVGSVPITSFKLNCFENTSLSCGGYYYQQRFSGFTLVPGDSITVTTPFVAKYLGLITAPFANVQYCFYTTLPNGGTDKTFEDNELCVSQLLLVTSLAEVQGNNSTFARIYPNPAENQVKVESDQVIRSIEICNSMGHCLSSDIINGKAAELNTLGFASGIYFIKIETEHGTIVRKLIRQ